MLIRVVLDDVGKSSVGSEKDVVVVVDVNRSSCPALLAKSLLPHGGVVSRRWCHCQIARHGEQRALLSATCVRPPRTVQNTPVSEGTLQVVEANAYGGDCVKMEIGGSEGFCT